jgi:hypothetical protein
MFDEFSAYTPSATFRKSTALIVTLVQFSSRIAITPAPRSRNVLSWITTLEQFDRRTAAD